MNIEQIGKLLKIEVTDQPEQDVIDLLERGKDQVIDGKIKKGAIKSHKLNASIILECDSRTKDKFTYNEFNDQIYIDDRCYEDHDTTEIELWLHRVYGVRLGAQNVNDIIIRQAKKNNFHPLKEYLNSLSWDGVCRLETLLQTYWGVEDTELLREIGFRWAISCVARALRAPVKVDTVLMLVGPQGAYKSSSFRVLAGEEWFSDSHLDIMKKEAYELIHKSGVWIWEMAENVTINKADNDTVKKFFGAENDLFRPSYGRNPVRRDRSLVLVSTTNEQMFLTDTTGNRRFWPVIVGPIDLEGIQRDRDQIWAEAVHYLNNNEPHYLDAEMDWRLYEYQQQFVIKHPWTTAIERLIEDYPEGFTNQEILQELGMSQTYKASNDTQRQINAICYELGRVYKKRKLERFKTPKYVWICQDNL